MAARFDKFLGRVRDWASKASDISDSGAAGRDILRMDTLAEIQSSVSGADYVAGLIGEFTRQQASTAKILPVTTGTKNQGELFVVGNLTVRLASSGGTSLQFSFNSAANVNVISKLTASTNSSGYIFNFICAAGEFYYAQAGLNIIDAGALQEVTLTNVTTDEIYSVSMLVGPGYDGNYYFAHRIK